MLINKIGNSWKFAKENMIFSFIGSSGGEKRFLLWTPDELETLLFLPGGLVISLLEGVSESSWNMCGPFRHTVYCFHVEYLMQPPTVLT